MTTEEIRDIPDIDGSDGVVAVVVRGVTDFDRPGVLGLTDRNDSIQVIAVKYPAGHVVPAHYHKPKVRLPCETQEVLLVVSGVAVVDVYNSLRQYLTTRSLGPGDMVVLRRGGHRVTCGVETRLLEFKTGPYLGRDADKVEFVPEGE